MFDAVVGQEEPKKKLAFYLDAYHKTHIMPNLMFCAQKGQGKTLIATETGKQLVVYGEDGKPLMKDDGKDFRKKPFIEVNAASIKNLSGLVNMLLGVARPEQRVVDRNVTVFIDEAHNLKNDVTQGLLTLMAPNTEHRNRLDHDGNIVELDFRRQTFIFATSESQSVFAPLMSRFKRIDLQPYSLEDLAVIVNKSAKDVTFKDDVLETIATVVRGNARECVKIADDIVTYLTRTGKKEFGKSQWRNLCSILSIKPMGLSPIEIQILRLMEERPEGCSLTNLAARSGLSPEAIRRDYEYYLQYCGLMAITAGKGRTLTGKGQTYLKELAEYEESMVKV